MGKQGNKMSDYTPTTEIVRDSFCESYVDHLSWFKGQEFDRWLAEVRAEAWDCGHDAGVENTISDDPYIKLINPFREGENSE